MPAKSKRSHKSSSTRKSSTPRPASPAGSLKQSSKNSSTRSKAAHLSSRRRGGVGTLGLLLMLAALIVVAVIYFGRRSSTGEAAALPTEITTAQAYEKYQAGAFFLDVREQDEWDAGNIPNTTHIPLGELASRVDELPQDQEIVVVCRSGNRSTEGRDILLQSGFTSVTSMAGGVRDWGNAGYPFEGMIP